MCARGAQHSTPDAIAKRFGVTAPLPNLQARYNAAPTQGIGIVRHDPRHHRRSLDEAAWGLVPHWTKDTKPAFNTINARSETVRTAPAFRSAWQAGRRCLVPFDLFYEWKTTGEGDQKKKQPFAIARPDRAPLGIAGLWESKRLEGDQILRSFTILTTTASTSMAALHDRMPVILAPDDWPAWLGETDTSLDDLYGLLRPCPANDTTFWPVDPRVGNWRNDDPGLMAPIAATA